MLTGKRVFAGETMAETLASVMKEQLTFADLPAETPAALRKLVTRCLERDLRRRTQSIGEARIVLEDIIAGVTPDEPVRPAPAAPPASKLPWAVAAAGLIAAAAFAAFYYLQPSPETPVVNATLLPPDGTDFFFGGGGSTIYGNLALSPDGARIVFAAKAKDGKQQLWVRRLDSSAAQPLTGTEDAYLAFWSPDSRWIAFAQGKTLKKIDVQGGPPLIVVELPTDFGGGSWSPEGIILC
jgi:serine/threonine-protein kinase